MLTKPLSKPIRTTMFVLGLTMLTLAGAFDQTEETAQPTSQEHISHCKDTGSSNRAFAAPEY